MIMRIMSTRVKMRIMIMMIGNHKAPCPENHAGTAFPKCPIHASQNRSHSVRLSDTLLDTRSSPSLSLSHLTIKFSRTAARRQLPSFLL